MIATGGIARNLLLKAFNVTLMQGVIFNAFEGPVAYASQFAGADNY